MTNQLAAGSGHRMGLNDALLCLSGLALGDAFGQSFFREHAAAWIARRELPSAPWYWTDDTQTAIAVVEELSQHDYVDQDSLARRMAQRYLADPLRGFSPQTRQTLERIGQGEYHRSVSRAVYEGGSFGCASAPRAVPLGAFFAGQPLRAAREGRLTAAITHYHPEAQAGAQAVAVAASLCAVDVHPDGSDLLQEVASCIAESQVREGLLRAAGIPANDVDRAVRTFHVGSDATVLATVPFALWCAAHHLDDYQEALWTTVRGLGSRDSNCAIAGGLVALTTRQLPSEWLDRREALPGKFQIYTGRSEPAGSPLTAGSPLPADAQPHSRINAGLPSMTGVTGPLSLPKSPAAADYEPTSIHRDTLTGLPNLLSLLEAVEARAEQTTESGAIAESGAFGTFSLVAVQLEGLWEINRTHGRTVGDEYLRCCARGLQASPNPVYRAGGDKFVTWVEASPEISESAGTSTRQRVNEQVARLRAVVEGCFPQRMMIVPQRTARLAVIHFPHKEDAKPGVMLACLAMALSDAFHRNAGQVQRHSAGELRHMENFPYMLQDLATQILRMGATAKESIRLAHTDSISQLPNMRAALSALDMLVKSSSQGGKSLAVLMIDGDNLRRFNQISYEAGDEAIRLLGSTLKAQLRETDFLARWRTGDEFLILLPETTQAQAVEVSQRLCLAVEQASQTWLFPSTISIGLAMLPEHGPSARDLLLHAEQGLEEAKGSGKNMVRVG